MYSTDQKTIDYLLGRIKELERNNNELLGMISISSNTVENLQREIGAWADATFPGQTIRSIYNHLVEEVNELGREAWDDYNLPPGEISELADVFILTLQLARRAGIDIMAEARKKFEINKERTWEGTRHAETD